MHFKKERAFFFRGSALDDSGRGRDALLGSDGAAGGV